MSETKTATVKPDLDIKKLLLDNGIIIVLLILVLITGVLKDNFFSLVLLSPSVFRVVL